MDLIIIVLFIVALVTYFEYKHLSKNNIRHDENIYLVISIISTILAVILLSYTYNRPTLE